MEKVAAIDIAHRIHSHGFDALLLAGALPTRCVMNASSCWPICQPLSRVAMVTLAAAYTPGLPDWDSSGTSELTVDVKTPARLRPGGGINEQVYQDAAGRSCSFNRSYACSALASRRV